MEPRLSSACGRAIRDAVANVAVDYQKISVAIKELARITGFLSSEVLWIGGYGSSLMPTAQYDVVENLENPIAPDDRQKETALVWERTTYEWDAALDDIGDLINPPAEAKYSWPQG